MRADLIDIWMPRCDFNSFHGIDIEAPADVVYEEVLALDLSGRSLTGFLFAVRSLPALFTGSRDRKPLHLTLDGLEKAGFVLLEEDRGRELVLGLVGRPWVAAGDIRRVSPEEFSIVNDPILAKMVWNFRVEGAGSLTRLTTETRVLTLSEGANRSFRRYWRLIAPFSGMVRIEALLSIKRNAEKRHVAETASVR
jgi:hypothetical protein